MTEESLTKVINKPYDSFINPEIYAELTNLAKYSLKNCSRSNTLNTCDVVNNAVIKIYKHKSGYFKSRGHFFSLMTNIMRNLVIDHARKKQAAIHGSGCEHVTLSNIDISGSDQGDNISKLMDIDRSMRKLGENDKSMEQIMVMRFYGGVEIKDVAEYFELSISTVKRKLRFAKAFMKAQLQ